jgi:uncharacterized membrane protein
MGKTYKAKQSNVKVVLWFILIIEVLILLLAIIFGSLCGFKNSLIAHGILGLILGSCLILLLITITAFNYLLSIFDKHFVKDK